MIESLSRWTGVRKDSLAKYETEKLRGYFNRAADPKMCALAVAASAVFAAGALASYKGGHPVDAGAMLLAAITDGWAGLYHYGELKKVRAELSGPK